MGLNQIRNKLRVLGIDSDVIDENTLLSKSNEGMKLYKVCGNKDIHTPLYNSIKLFKKSGLAVVESNNAFGLINKDLEEIIKPMYKEITIYDEQIISVRDARTCGVFDIELNQLTPQIYEYVQSVFKINKKYFIVHINKDAEQAVYKYDGKYCNRLYDKFEYVSRVTPNGYLLNLSDTNNYFLYDTENNRKIEINEPLIYPGKTKVVLKSTGEEKILDNKSFRVDPE
jgi:hypothetical protein